MRSLALTCLLGCATAMCYAADPPSATGLDGCLYWLDGTCAGWSQQQWRDEARAMREAGLRHVIVSAVAEAALAEDDAQLTAAKHAGDAAQAGTTRPATQPARSEDPILTACDRLMRVADEAGLRIYLSLCAQPGWYVRWRLVEEIDANRRVIPLLMKRYAAHTSFAGWYIPHEIYVMWDAPGQYMRDLYRELSKLCKAATPDRPVILSPFFILDHEGWLGSFRYATPKEYEDFWADLLAKTQIDIIAVQDSGEHLSCYTMDQRRPFLTAMRNACRRAGKQFWVNIETGELDVASYEDFARRFGRGTSVNDAKTGPFWKPVSPEKLQQKLRLAHEFTDTTITWGYREYWDPLRSGQMRKQYDAYRAAASQPSIVPR